MSRPRLLLLTVLLAGAVPSAASSSTALAPIRDLAARGRTYEALRQLEPMLAELSSQPEALLLKGVLLAELGRRDEAEQIFLSLTQTHPELPEPYNNLAALHGADGDYEQAVQVLKLALRTHPSYRTAYDNLTKVYGKLAARAYGEALGRQASNRPEPIELALLSEIGAAPGDRASSQGEERVMASVRPLDRLGEEGPASPSGPGGAETMATSPAGRQEQTTDEEGDDSVPSRSGLEDAKAMVDAWAAAWSAQRIEEYLSFYGDVFAPPGGLARDAWEAQRRDRLSRPSFIRVEVAPLDAERTAEGRARLRFRQTYESDRFSDEVIKVMELAWGEGSWKIVSELVEE